MKLFRCVTFGCRVNQYETQAVREALQSIGWREAGEGERPAWVVINSCTVTGAADAECLSLVRSLRRADPGVRVAVMGCLVQRDSEALKSLPGVALLVGTGQKHRVAELVEGIEQNLKPVPGTDVGFGTWYKTADSCQVPDVSNVRLELELGRVYSPLAIASYKGMQKAFVKVQDGCDRACAFCKIPYVRGRSRSRPLREVVEEVGRLVSAGYREVVLTGVAIGLWGREAGAGETLADLTRAVDALPGRFRARLSSLDPRDLDEGLTEALGGSRRFCRHLHLSLQSGSDPVLERMNRGYTAAGYRERVDRMRRRWPDLGLTTDVIAGFPGETEPMFRETLAFCREMRFAGVHVFPYSRRKGTSAGVFSGPPDPRRVRERAAELRRAAQETAAGFRRGLLGTLQEVLVEGPLPALSGCTGQSVRVALPGAGRELLGRLVRVRMRPSAAGEGLEGEIFPVAPLTN